MYNKHRKRLQDIHKNCRISINSAYNMPLKVLTIIIKRDRIIEFLGKLYVLISIKNLISTNKFLFWYSVSYWGKIWFPWLGYSVRQKKDLWTVIF